MFWPRTVLPEDQAKVVCDALQKCLVHTIDTALTCKQAHWNLYGKAFLAVHERLDPIVDNARAASDEFAERINQLGGVPDGRVASVAAQTTVPAYSGEYVEDTVAVKAVSDQMIGLSKVLRE
ncbi:MAG: ferritin-like domain-containing protein, partial [Planctomycetota bacterium]